MFIKSLNLFNFRNLANQEVVFAPGINLILGPNAQGKTNLIEAISILSLTRSFRTTSLRELVKWGEISASVFANVNMFDSEIELGVVIEEGKRQVYLGQQRLTSVADFVGKLLCVSFSPSELALVKGPPLQRRRFIDKHITDLEPGMIRTFFDYQKAIKSKALLLKAEQASEEEIEPWNQILSRLAKDILIARKRFLDKLEVSAQQVLRRLSKNDGELKLHLKSNLLRNNPKIESDLILSELNRSKKREIAAQSVILGPHRDEIEILLDGKSTRSYASQGQARSLVLALKLGVVELLEMEKGDTPLVLLDDVDSELDERRRQALLEQVLAKKGQVFITSTNSALKGIEAQSVIRIEQGNIIASSE